jgi:hypothetical protein
MGILGHSQIGLTMNTYGHLFEVMQPETAAKIDAILTPTPPASGTSEPQTIH